MLIICCHASTHTGTFSKSCQSKTNLGFDYTFPIDFAPNLIPFGAKSTGKWKLQPKFGLG